MDIQERELSSWDEIHSFAQPAWIYRGQRASEWQLATSLERCRQREDVPAEDRPRFEAELSRDFRRMYHQYAQHVPAPAAPVEWASLMQHHGAPTRLLDFTYSIYVAAYFAFENADSHCAVWAVNAPWTLRESVRILVAAGVESAAQLLVPTTEAHEFVAGKAVFREPGARFAVPMTPFRLNERLRTQRGTFLVPGSVSSGFMDNLRALPNYSSPDSVVKIVLPKPLRARALEHLYSMNISRTSLFPGLDGYAQSLGVFHPSFRPVPW